jgi:hypothetical protein
MEKLRNMDEIEQTCAPPLIVRDDAGAAYITVNNDGSTTFDWAAIRREAAAFNYPDVHAARVIARAVWCAANPGVDP